MLILLQETSGRRPAAQKLRMQVKLKICRCQVGIAAHDVECANMQLSWHRNIVQKHLKPQAILQLMGLEITADGQYSSS